ncbi:MAG: dicarboxylate/amino acid:cation symporter [Gemmatimonadaceae bacterium]|nr:dicarboxylate/amino acid:cation symporter [Gemmatimonadaceae bacterium]
MARLSLTTRVLLALVAGLGLGVVIATSGSPALLAVGKALEPLGTLFVNGIRMTIIPLVVSSLIVGIAAAPDAATIGRLGGRALLFMVVSVAVAAALGVTVAGPLFDAFPIDPAATAALRTNAAGAGDAAAQSAKAVPGFAQWLTDLVPVNPVKAAADGAMLPLIVFSVAFGIAVTRLEPTRRAALVPVLEAIQDASLTLVRWVLGFAPLGVFGLAVPLAAKLGVSAVGALATYVGVVSVLSIVLILLLYPVAAALGRVSLATFARAALPPQAMAFSGRSSLAAMPAMITATRDTLALPAQIPGFLVPLLTSTFRVGAGIGQTVAVVFVAHLYGVALTPAQLATVAVTTVISSFSVPGIPGGTIVGMIPVLMAAGVPVEGAGILLGVDTIPDMFRTTANVTGDMAAAVVLGGREVASRDN